MSTTRNTATLVYGLCEAISDRHQGESEFDRGARFAAKQIAKGFCSGDVGGRNGGESVDWKEMYERREEEAHQLSEEIIRLRRAATVTDHQILDCFVTAKGEGQAAYMVAVGRAILALAATGSAS